ncbi:MAG TPA: hypothetical protein VNB54_06685, partial [Alphaproteobacteria bacterium]|nr:hypothetical protein [Alphaproteobacteria bacterium]
YGRINPGEVNFRDFRHFKILAAQSHQIKIPAGALTLQHAVPQSHLFQHCCLNRVVVFYFDLIQAVFCWLRAKARLLARISGPEGPRAQVVPIVGFRPRYTSVGSLLFLICLVSSGAPSEHGT